MITGRVTRRWVDDAHVLHWSVHAELLGVHQDVEVLAFPNEVHADAQEGDSVTMRMRGEKFTITGVSSQAAEPAPTKIPDEWLVQSETGQWNILHPAVFRDGGDWRVGWSNRDGGLEMWCGEESLTRPLPEE